MYALDLMTRLVSSVLSGAVQQDQLMAYPHDSGMICVSQLTCPPDSHTLAQAKGTNLLL